MSGEPKSGERRGWGGHVERSPEVWDTGHKESGVLRTCLFCVCVSGRLLACAPCCVHNMPLHALEVRDEHCV